MAVVTVVPNSVLVVDDELVVLQILKSVLSSRGIDVMTATSAEEAVEALSTRGFGCVVTDKNLPGKDGLEILRQVRRLQPRCACIIMTAYSNTASVIEALRLGATDYLEKPFPDLDLLVTKVERAIKAKQLELDRDEFLEKLLAYQHELESTSEWANRQHTEIQMFEEVLELRVKQATADLEKRCKLSEQCLATSKDVDFAAKVHAESIHEYVKSVSFEGSDPVSVEARAALTRIARRLESHIGLLDRFCGGDSPSTSTGDPR